MSIYKIVADGNSYQLIIDLSTYCKSCKNLHLKEQERENARRALEEAKLKQKEDLSEPQHRYDDACTNVAIANVSHTKIRAPFVSEFYPDIASSQLWYEISHKLIDNGSIDDRLKELLQIPSYAEVKPPLAFISLEMSLMELVKNSVDALIEQYLFFGAINTTLIIDFSFRLTDTSIEVVIRDNGGGISVQKEREFAKHISQKDYKKNVSDKPISTKAHQPMIYFGGANLGTDILCNFILDGEILDGPGVSRVVYNVIPGETTISFRNCRPRTGLQITISSPIKPPELYQAPVPVPNIEKIECTLRLLSDRKKNKVVISPRLGQYPNGFISNIAKTNRVNLPSELYQTSNIEKTECTLKFPSDRKKKSVVISPRLGEYPNGFIGNIGKTQKGNLPSSLDEEFCLIPTAS